MGRKKKGDAPATDVVAEVEQILDPESVLYSSEKGSIACTDHTPMRGTDTWKFDRWRKMTAEDIEAFERELGHKIACETCAAVKRNEAKDEPAPVEPIADAPAVEPTPKKKKERKTGEMVISDLADRYLAHMEKEGKSSGTCFSYRLELQTAMGELGADTIVGNLTPARIRKYFDCERVTKKRNGKAKSPLSIAKTRRVLRMALEWAATKGWIQFVWVPESEATH